jgi:hypothetical protein
LRRTKGRVRREEEEAGGDEVVVGAVEEGVEARVVEEVEVDREVDRGAAASRKRGMSREDCSMYKQSIVDNFPIELRGRHQS